MRTIEEYKMMFTKMAVNKKGDKIAPHKAILLLAVIDLIENGNITNSYIPLSDELIRVFNDIWKRNVPVTSHYNCKFSYPFFHFQSSPFWKLIKTDNYIGQKEYSSISPLRRDFIGAKIDDDLFQYLSNQKIRDDIRQLLHKTYLTKTIPLNPSNLGLMVLISIMFSVA